LGWTRCKQIYVGFEGVFQVADVYVNGQYLGQHRGGYTRFTFDATRAIAFCGDDVLAVMLSNKDCADCLPDTNTCGTEDCPHRSMLAKWVRK